MSSSKFNRDVEVCLRGMNKRCRRCYKSMSFEKIWRLGGTSRLCVETLLHGGNMLDGRCGLLFGHVTIVKRLLRTHMGKAMTTHIGLLRAVNLPGHNKVGMPDLCRMLSELGLKDARSLLQSGNVV